MFVRSGILCREEVLARFSVLMFKGASVNSRLKVSTTSYEKRPWSMTS
jgi:hypothetical protein